MNNIEDYYDFVRTSCDVARNKLQKHHFKRKFWTNNERINLYRLSNKMSYEELCLHFQRSVDSIYYALMRKYSDKNIALLEKHKNQLSNAVVKDKKITKKYKLNKKVYTSYLDYFIALKNSKNRYNSYSEWTNEDDELLAKLSKTMSVKELCDHFKRIPGGIRSRLRKLSLDDSTFANDKVTNIEMSQQDILEEAALLFLNAVLHDADPVTGEVFDQSSIWAHPQIKNDIRKYLDEFRVDIKNK
tara:strand:+ start:277 stop:1008 length:732 start_codon:yes stop_codon:yes gene_type:complete